MNRDEQIKLEHTTLLEEYRTMREEVISTLDSIRQMTNITVTAVAGLIVGFPFMVDAKLPTLFLVVPLFFYLLSWIHIRHSFSMVTLSNYLTENVVPRIRQSIAEMDTGRGRSFDYLMTWEQFTGRKPYFNILLLPITTSHYALPLLTSIFLLAVYFYITIYVSPLAVPVIDRITFLDRGFLVANLLAFLYSVFLGIWVQYSLHHKKLEIIKKSNKHRAHGKR